MNAFSDGCCACLLQLLVSSVAAPALLSAAATSSPAFAPMLTDTPTSTGLAPALRPTANHAESSALGAAKPNPILFDRIVAWVDGETVSQNELFAEASLARVLAQGDSALSHPPSEAELQQVLRRLVGDMLVAREARRVGAEAPESEQTEREMALMLERFASPEAYGAFVRRLGIDDAFVLDSINRRLLIEQYLAQRLRTRLMHDGQRPTGSGKRQSTVEREREREERFLAMVAAYRQDLWRTVPVRLLRPGGVLERVMSPVP